VKITVVDSECRKQTELTDIFNMKGKRTSTGRKKNYWKGVLFGVH
jgi:hypothetical protein